MFTDLYLKFTDEAQASSVLYTQVPTAYDEEGSPVEFEQQANYRNIDTLGILYEGGEWDNEGNVIVAATELEGWHVNVRVMPDEDAAALNEYAVEPQFPRRIWG
jgi:hypothetical protein